jgi:hypothetical protein
MFPFDWPKRRRRRRRRARSSGLKSHPARVFPSTLGDANDASPPMGRLTLGEIGELGQVWFLSALRPVRRHVETITLESASGASRKLTIDILLPRHGDGSVPWRDGERLYYLPIALLRKTPATLDIDFTREDGRTLPILNRVENAQITWQAVDGVTQQLLQLRDRPRELMRKYLRGAIFDGRPEYQAAYVACALGVVRQTRPELIEGNDADRDEPRPSDAAETPAGPADGAPPSVELLQLRQLWKDVAAHSVLWLGLTGIPGDRRVLHFTYHVPVTRPPMWPRRSRWVDRVLAIEGVERPFRLFKVGDGNNRGAISRVLNRFATAIGWAGYDIAIDSPYVRRTESYHLQFSAPEGIEVRDIRLRAELVNSVGRRHWPETTDNRERASLYFFGLRVWREGPAEIVLRIGRRGFLGYVTGASVVVAGMLWLFSHYARALQSHEVVAVPILLVVPALLALFILRPGEHALASRMLSGARSVILADALLCAAAAAAVGGVLPFHWRSLGAAWHAYAEAATVLAAVLIVSWLLALDVTEALRRRTRWVCRSYRRYGALAIALCLTGWAAGELAPYRGGRGADDIAWASVLILVGLAAGWASLFAGANTSTLTAIRARGLFSGALRVAALGCLVAAPLILQFDLDLWDWGEARGIVRYALIAAALISVLVEPARRIGFPPPVQDEPELRVADVPETWKNVDGQPAPSNEVNRDATGA